MKPIYLFSLLALLAACKKENTEPSKPVTYAEPDFALIPTKDAKWYVHGMAAEGCFFATQFNLEAMKNDLIKIDFIIDAVGKDTIIDMQIFHVYQVVRYVAYPGPDSFYQKNSYRYYLREDIEGKKIYFTNGEVALDFSDAANEGQVTPFYTWRTMNITKPDSLIIQGQYFKRWNMRNAYDQKLEYFYKAIGIGSASGILGTYAFTGLSQVVSLDFVYKGDSVHFDYPLQ